MKCVRWIAVLALVGCAKEPLPVLGSAPDFALTAQDGKSFGSAELKGHAWVANFVFTRCPTVCPPFSAKMAAVAQKAPAGVKLVSFSVDPEYDTPAVLAAYAGTYQAKPEQWSFVTGERAAMEAVVVKGLFQPMDKGDGTLVGIGHSTRFVLVDKKGQIRGFYGSKEDDVVERLVTDAQRVENEP